MLASVKAEAECAMCNDDEGDDESDATVLIRPFLSPSLPKLAYAPLLPSSSPSRLVSNRDDEKAFSFPLRYQGRSLLD